MTGPGDLGYRPPLDSVLRRLRGEARRDERALLARRIRAMRGDDADPRTVNGRKQPAYDAVLALLEPVHDEGSQPWTARFATVNSASDTVEVGTMTEPDDDGPEPWPVRLRVSDGAEMVTADAFLTADEALALAEALARAGAAAKAAQQ